jgi:hypothetical protein
VSVTSPATVTIKNAYKVVPDAKVALPDLPVVINLTSFAGQVASANMRILSYRVRMQCFVGRATVDDALNADLSVALWEKMLDNFSADLTLAGNVSLALFDDDGNELPSRLEWAGQAYIGFTALLNLQITQAFTFS